MSVLEKPRKLRRPGKNMMLVLEFMHEFFKENDQLPPCHVVCAQFGFKSDNAAHEHMVALSKRGFIEKNSVGKWRFTRAPTVEAFVTDAAKARMDEMWAALCTDAGLQK